MLRNGRANRCRNAISSTGMRLDRAYNFDRGFARPDFKLILIIIISPPPEGSLHQHSSSRVLRSPEQSSAEVHSIVALERFP